MGKTDQAVTSSNQTEFSFIVMRLKWEIKPGVFSEIIVVMQRVFFFDLFVIWVGLPEEEVVIVVDGVVEGGFLD